MRFLTSVILAAAAGFALNVMAQPVIDRISMTDDGYIEIFGSGFGQKSPVLPLLWMDFENASGQSLSRYVPPASSVNGVKIQDPSSSNNSVLLFDLKSSKAGGPTETVFESDHLYINLRRHYKFSIDNPVLHGSSGGGGVNLKTMRLWASFDSGNNHNFYFGYQGKEGLASGRLVAETTGVATNWIGHTAEQKGFEWLDEEIIYKASGIDKTDGVYQYIRNGVFGQSKLERHRTSSRQQRYRLLFLDQVSNYNLSNPLEVMYDDIYVDETYSRVVITNSPSSTTYNQALVQIPVEWRDNYIKVKARTGKLGSNSYLYVFDQNNSSNRVGVKACPLCPRPPAL